MFLIGQWHHSRIEKQQFSPLKFVFMLIEFVQLTKTDPLDTCITCANIIITCAACRKSFDILEPDADIDTKHFCEGKDLKAHFCLHISQADD